MYIYIYIYVYINIYSSFGDLAPRKQGKTQAELLQTRSDEQQNKCRYYGLALACSDLAALVLKELLCAFGFREASGHM